MSDTYSSSASDESSTATSLSSSESGSYSGSGNYSSSAGNSSSNSNSASTTSSSAESSTYPNSSGSVAYEARRMSWFNIRASQTVTLLKKNVIIAKRRWGNTLSNFLIPSFFLLILLILDVSLRPLLGDAAKDKTSQGAVTPGTIPRCVTGVSSSCYTFAYSHSSNPVVQQLISHIRTNQPDLPVSEVFGLDTANSTAINEFILANDNVTQATYVFNNFGLNANPLPSAVEYTIQFNATGKNCEKADFWKCPQQVRDVVIPMQLAMNEALMAVVGTSSADLQVDFLPFAHPKYSERDIIQGFLSLWLIFAAMFPLIAQIGQLVQEKESKLRLGMRMMGLKDSAYWFSWYIWFSALNLLVVLTICAVGAAAQFRFFLNNDFGTYFFLLFLFGQCMIAWAFFFGSILSSSRGALVIGLLFFVVFGMFEDVFVQIIFYNVFEMGRGTQEPLEIIISFFPPTLFSKGVFDLATATSSDSFPGVRWNQRKSNSFTYPLDKIYRWMIGDFFLYMFLAWYLDNVLPSANGTARPVYFFLTPGYWMNKSHTTSKVSPDNDTESGASESIDEDVASENEAVRTRRFPTKNPPAVIVDNLVKVYRSWGRPVHKAVNNLSLFMEDQSVFCLLGPNGAGKTTTLSMLTGVLSLSGGSASFFDKQVDTDIDAIRADLGVCPQFDVLWPDLTAAEHIEIFAHFKGLPKDVIANEVEARLDDVDLLMDANGQAGVFSGGMRRRLSLAIALTGNPRVVYLDEPTTGMDPVSRRKVWNVIDENKRKRAILLTTHSMEEADTLGDRVAILANGKLRCIGSSLHLKQKYGAGYRVNVNLRGKGKKFCKAAQEEHDFITFELPSDRQAILQISPDNSSAVPEVLRWIEDSMDEYRIDDYQLSLSTLEDVFIRIAREAEISHAVSKLGPGVNYFTCPHEGCGQPIPDPGASVQILKCPRCQNQAVRDTTGGLMSVEVMPCAYCNSACTVPTVGDGFVCPYCGKENGSLASGTESATVTDSAPGNARQSLVSADKVNPAVQLKALMIKQAHLQKRQTCTNICQALIPLLLLALLVVLQVLVGNVDRTDDATPNPPHYASLSLWPGHDCNQTFRESWTEDKTDRFRGESPITQTPCVVLSNPPSIPYHLRNIPYIGTSGDPVIANTWKYTAGVPANPLYADREALQKEFFDSHFVYNPPADTVVKQSYLTAFEFRSVATATLNVDFSIYWNRTAAPFYNVIPGAIDTISNGLLGAAGYALDITTRIGALPENEKKSEFDVPSLVIPILLPFMLFIQFPVFLGNVMMEKEQRMIEIMKMMGLRKAVYWLSQFLFDFAMFFVVFLLVLIFGFIFQFRFFTATGFGLIFFLFLFWGWAMIPMAFVVSNLFGKARKATLTAYILVIMSAILALIFTPLVNEENNFLYTFLFQLYPFFAFHRGVALIAAASQPGEVPLSLANAGQVGGVIVMLLIEGIVFGFLVWYLDQVIAAGHGIRKNTCFCLEGLFKTEKKEEHDIELLEAKAADFVPMDEDDDVHAERRKAEETNQENQLVRVVGLRKEFSGGKVAVNSASFVIEAGECFGLLGHNGAGKTTLVNMLTGLFPPTFGHATICGLNSTTEMDRIHSRIGVCPQHDLLWADQSAREHMLFYGRLKKIPASHLPQAVDEALAAVGLLEVADRLSKTFSGGMKRRLSIAIALLGNPPVVFLDEPTTGLDPKSRRDVWDVITAARQGNTAIILTTHSMEEAEALCTRLAIMSGGTLKCIGSSAHLKAKFGSGYRLALTLDRDHLDSVRDLKKFVKELAPSSTHEKESLGANQFFHLADDDVESLPQLFEEMEEGLQEHYITDWAISQTTLDDVFVKINEEED